MTFAQFKDTVSSLPQAYLKSRLHYDPSTGIFTWILPPENHSRLLGKDAGGKTTGYVVIKIDGQKYKAHRLAWLYMLGHPVPPRIDHHDTDTLNNVFDNLREATSALNNANAKRWAGKSLPKGVREMPSGRFQARISFGKRQICLGMFSSTEEAANAYFAAAVNFYGEFARAA